MVCFIYLFRGIVTSQSNQIKAVRKMIFGIVRKALDIRPLPNGAPQRHQVSLSAAVAWAARETRLHHPDQQTLEFNLKLACVADETKPRYSPSANQRPKACSAPCVLPGFSIIGSNWLMHLAVLSCTVIRRVDLVELWLRSR